MSGLTWLDDGEHFLQVKDEQALQGRARTGRAEPFVDAEKLAKSLAALPTLDRRTVQDAVARPAQSDGPEADRGAVRARQRPVLRPLRRPPAVRLTRSPGTKETPTFSPDGRFVAFVRDGNLFVVDVADPGRASPDHRRRRRGPQRQGRLGLRRGDLRPQRPGVLVEPRLPTIAFLRFDDAPVHKFTLVNPLPLHQTVEAYPYPKAGDPNPLVKLDVVSAAGGDPVAVDLEDYSPTDSLDLPRRLAARQSRVYLLRPGPGPDLARLLHGPGRRRRRSHGCSAKRRRPGSTTPARRTSSSDGSFLFASERTGWKHLTTTPPTASCSGR